MTDTPPTGHDGPYPAPVLVTGRTVPPDWIDYNGHMNVGYYGIAFDQALDVMAGDHLGIGAVYVEITRQAPFVVQSHLHFLDELLEGDGFAVCFRLLDHDHKRLHLFAEMVADKTGQVAATQEVMLVHVDHASGRSVPFPDWAQHRFARMKADHADLPSSGQIGATMAIRR